MARYTNYVSLYNTCISDLPLLNYEITSIGKAKLGGGRLKISANVLM
jgi:hypothetical protein